MAALLPWLPRVHRQAAARGRSASCRRDPKRGLRHRTLRLPPHAKGSSGNGSLGWIIYLGSPPAILSPCIPHASSILYPSCISSRARNGTHASKYGVSNAAQRRQRPPQPLAHLPCTSRAPPVHLPCTSRAPLAQNSHIVRCLTLPVCAGAAQARRHLPSSASGRRRRLQCRLAALFALCPRPECGEPPWIRTSDPNQALPF